MVLNQNLPSFKNKTQSDLDVIPNSEVEFPTSTTLEKSTPIKNNVSAVKNGDGTIQNGANYSYSQKKSIASYASGIQSISNKTNTFQTSNVQPRSSGIQIVGNFKSNSPTFSNTPSNSFLANNTLTITTDLSENNSPMLIGGGSNPGDPGVPVGDGKWVLMMLLGIYWSLKTLLTNIHLA
jgi:hypothetical protein